MNETNDIGVFGIITQDQDYKDLLIKKFKKGSISKETKTVVETIISVKEREKLTLDDISLILGVKRSRLTKLIKESGFIWNKTMRCYSKDSVSKRVDLEKKKTRKKIVIKLQPSTSKLLDFVLEQKKCNEEILFKKLVEDCVQDMSSTEVIDIISS